MSKKNDPNDSKNSSEKPGPDSYEIGYGKPPKHSRFRKGQTGNPKGRPKGTRNFRTDVNDVLRTPVKLRSNGKTRNLSTQLAGLMRLREDALKGDAKALDRLLRLAALYNDAPVEAASENLPAADKAILDAFVARAAATDCELTGGNSVNDIKDADVVNGEDAT